MANEQVKQDIDSIVKQAQTKIAPATIERVKKVDHKLGELADKYNTAGEEIKKYVDSRRK